MANVPTVCEVNYDFDDYGYEEVIPLRHGTLSLTPRPNSGGVYRYDREYEMSLLAADKYYQYHLVSIGPVVLFLSMSHYQSL